MAATGQLAADGTWRSKGVTAGAAGGALRPDMRRCPERRRSRTRICLDLSTTRPRAGCSKEPARERSHACPPTERGERQIPTVAGSPYRRGHDAAPGRTGLPIGDDVTNPGLILIESETKYAPTASSRCAQQAQRLTTAGAPR